MRVFSNTAISLDGRIAPAGGGAVMLGSAADRRQMSWLRAQADAVLVGGETFRTWPRPLIEDPRRLQASPPIRPRERPLLNAVLTRNGVLPSTESATRPPPRFPDPRVELLILGPPTLDGAGHQARLGAEVLTTPQPSVDWALEILAARGCRAVLVEGGGHLLGALLEAGRLEEMFVTVCPLLLGDGGMPLVVAGALPAGGRLVLRSCQQVGSEMFLHYQVCH